jgi:opacity protein-like surface antigen
MSTTYSIYEGLISMKKFFAVIAILAASTSLAQAATITVEKTPHATGDAYALFIMGAEPNIAALGFSAKPNSPSTFLNLNGGLAAGQPRPAGQAFTYLNRYLNTPVDDLDIPGGKGWTLLDSATTAAELRFEGGPLGVNIDASQKLFLGNVFLPTNGQGTYSVVIKDATGANIGNILTGPIGIPEPATLALAGMGLIGLTAIRRRIA